jgi:HSP20 family protein
MIVRHRSPFTAGFATGLPVGFDRSIDRAFDQLTSQLFEPRRRVPTVEGRWDDGTLVLVVDLPGVPAEAVSVEVSGRTLTLGAHTEHLDWSRQVELGTSLDPEKVAARHLDGRLTVTIGQVDAPATRRVAIDTSPAPAPAAESIEAQSSEAQSIETSETD